MLHKSTTQRVCSRRRVPSDLVGLYSSVSRPGQAGIRFVQQSTDLDRQSTPWNPLAAINSGEDRSLHGM